MRNSALRLEPCRESRRGLGDLLCAFAWCCLGVIAGGMSGGSAAESNVNNRVSAEAMGVLKANCIGCHNASKKKGGLILESSESLARGGDNGPVIAPGNPADSPLLSALAPDADPHMPPKKQLDEDAIQLLRAWIEEGAHWNARAFEEAVVIPSVDPARLGALPDSYHPVLALSLSPDGTLLAVGRGNRIEVYDVGETNHNLLRRLDAHRDAVQALAWSSDGKWLASGGFRRVCLWNAEAFSLSHELTDLIGRVSALGFTSDCRSIIVAEGIETQSGLVHVWPVGSSKVERTWTAHDDTILDLELSPDGKLLASASVDRLIKFWKVPGFEGAGVLEGHNGPVIAVAFKPDGSLLASGGADLEVKIWDVRTRAQTAAIGGHSSAVTDLSWTSDGKTILTASEDGKVRRCDESKKRPEKTIGDQSDVVYSLVVSADGKRTYAGGHDGLVYVWDAKGKLAETIDGTASDKETAASAPSIQ